MEYQYSNLIEPSQYETDGLCDSLLVHKHVAEDVEEIGTFKAQEDWRSLVGPLSHYKGGLGPRHNFMAVSLMECLPERFEIVSYANEFAFLHDDVTDIPSQQKGDIENDQVLDAFREGARNGQIDALDSVKRQMQAKILNTIICLDRPRAFAAMRAWAAFVEQGAGRQHHQQIQTLEDYLPYRTRDVGHMFWHALVTFGCAITIPEEEMGLCTELVLPAVIAASLTNDLFSYEKEYEAAQAAGLTEVVNALWVLMREHKISLEEAKSMCRMRIREEVAKYTRIITDTQPRKNLSSDLKRCIELMQYSVSGNVVWSLQCPRYHSNMQYNERQLLRQKHGASKHPTTYQLAGQKKRAGMDLEQTSTPGKKICTGAYPDLDGESGQNSRTTQATDSPYQSFDVLNLVQDRALPKLGNEIVLEPYRYVSSLPSKGVRDMVIDGIDIWLGVRPQSTAIIRNVVKTIHNSSIMLDDLQDGSELRRGSPATHVVFGISSGANFAVALTRRAVGARLQPPITGTWAPIFMGLTERGAVPDNYKMFWTSHEQHDNALVINADKAATMWGYYKPRIESLLFNPLAPPLNQIGEMPKMFLQVAGHDMFRDDGLILAYALQDHGVDVKLEVYPGVCHSFWVFASSLSLSKRFESDIVEEFAWLLGVSTDSLSQGWETPMAMPAIKIDDGAESQST